MLLPLALLLVAAGGASGRARFRLPLLLAAQVTRSGITNVVAVPRSDDAALVAFNPASLIQQLGISIQRQRPPSPARP